ncbi:hypothetical protein [Asticcacaulis sp. AC402]|uniref:hypothetical protein n=1 Tax=Asticcacaulis sp. AC402 TaxID=1282361 RepID=UPI0003C3BD46|nr:hypothetical protein [Asticcacaulis sp. AC402]ESQ76621.1 hypothetical protein ABAC402_02805 [Asticcacaulis sp. AC402]
MISTRVASLSAWLFTGLGVTVIAFQLALAAGMPWGHLAMAGVYPGVFPIEMRIAAVAQAAVFGLMIAIVLGRAGVIEVPRVFLRLIWGVIVLMALSFGLNLITPSAEERLLWAPVAFGLLVSSLLVALARRS